ncbi:MAG: shikimate dehydrogenase [Vicingus serpentipes]|nr:shikimate dehydrogenase [Vicingus serpentipes]
MKQYGLIGYPLSHSFSANYFAKKFEKENIKGCAYQAYEIDSIEKLSELIKSVPNLIGLNVTIPYKQDVFKYLSSVDEVAKNIGAVNTIKIDQKNQEIKGYNTDYYGFKQSLKPFLENNHQRALILGTGGASKAVYYVLKELNIDCIFVSRNPTNDNEVAYEDVNEHVIRHHQLIVNTTPIGMYPKVDAKPELPYQYLTTQHLLYDLVYNPLETAFLKEGKKKGCITINGLDMLQLQAEKSWEIWNK